METVKDNALEIYQQQMEATREISERFFEGTGRIESVLLEQARKIFDEQMKFFRATAAIRDPQGLMALHSAFFSHSPEDLIKAQQQIFDVTSDAQSKIAESVNKYMNVLTARGKALQGEKNEDLGSENTLYAVWQKSFNDAIELASVGLKAMPLIAPDLGAAVGKRGNARTKK